MYIIAKRIYVMLPKTVPTIVKNIVANIANLQKGWSYRKPSNKKAIEYIIYKKTFFNILLCSQLRLPLELSHWTVTFCLYLKTKGCTTATNILAASFVARDRFMYWWCEITPHPVYIQVHKVVYDVWQPQNLFPVVNTKIFQTSCLIQKNDIIIKSRDVFEISKWISSLLLL